MSPKNPKMEERYEEDRERERKWSVTIVHYLISVVSLILFMAVALGGYWLWSDFASSDGAHKGEREMTWPAVRASLSDNFKDFIKEVRNPCPLMAEASCN